MSLPLAALEDNQLLATLTSAERDSLLPDLQPVELDLGATLIDVGHPVGHVHFPTYGIISVTSLVDGEAFESATVGREGFVGLPVVLGGGLPDTRAMVQVGGRSLQMPVERFRAHLADSARLRELLVAYSQIFAGQVARNGACARAHQIQHRCARWMLLISDRMGSDRFALKQEFLAQMLGVRRASISQAASTLAQLNCIDYRRGLVTIIDRAALEKESCSCYAAIRGLLGRIPQL